MYVSKKSLKTIEKYYDHSKQSWNTLFVQLQKFFITEQMDFTKSHDLALWCMEEVYSYFFVKMQ